MHNPCPYVILFVILWEVNRVQWNYSSWNNTMKLWQVTKSWVVRSIVQVMHQMQQLNSWNRHSGFMLDDNNCMPWLKSKKRTKDHSLCVFSTKSCMFHLNNLDHFWSNWYLSVVQDLKRLKTCPKGKRIKLSFLRINCRVGRSFVPINSGRNTSGVLYFSGSQYQGQL